jgi:tRNA threonylcarbamoyladenosine biosynthesis protein TsaB
MKILGIETSTKTGSVAVVSESGVIAQYSLNIEVTHSERLMSTVDRVLKDTGLAIGDLDGFSVALGPGSFTGLRIGIATVKGLAFATGKPVAAVSTLKALAANLPFASHAVCPLLDARKKEVYAALYRQEGEILVVEMPESAIPIVELAERIPGTVIFTGEGAHLYRAVLEESFGGRAFFAPPVACLPSAAIVAAMGLSFFESGQYLNPDELAPLYIRKPEAEVAWEKRRTLK